MLRILLISSLLLLAYSISHCQLSDSIPTLEIVDYKIIHSTDQNRSFDVSTVISQLGTETNLQIRSNGPSLLTTPLLRGMSARHTAIVWDGWNILSPVNGVYDLSLLPSGLQQAKLIKEPVSDILGNGSAAGAILINPQRGSYLSTSINSIGNKQLSISHDGTLKKWSTQLALSQQWNDNKYSYRASNNEKAKRDNNRHLQTDLQWSNHYELDSTSHFEFNLWSQVANREIAPSILAAYREDVQLDDNYRLSAGYEDLTRLGKLSIRGAYFIEQTIFDNALIDRSIARNHATKARVVLSNTNHDRWQYSSSYILQHDRVVASFFMNEALDRTIHAINHNGQLNLKDWQIVYGLRLDLPSGQSILESYHAKASYRLSNATLYAGIARGYQLPNFNDLYWPTGGNPNLETERSWTYRVGMEHSLSIANVTLDAYSIQATDWIIWSPDQNNIWTPDNRRSVSSRGIDLAVDFSPIRWASNKQIAINASYSFTDARVKADEQVNVIDKQLIYIPKHKLTSQFELEYEQLGISIDAQYIGKRFTNNSNEQSLDPFLFMNASLHCRWDLPFVNSLLTSFQLYNITNQDYQYIQFFPMPLRYAELSITLTFN